MVATAPPAARWLLVEREGAWPTHALSAFSTSEARALSDRAARLGARITLIRRPGRHPATSGGLLWAVADVRPGREGIRWHHASSVSEIAGATWDVEAGEGEPVALVCSHSRHDVCCALRGRPVAAALETQWPGRVWECSHLGGDRFAATMVLLPQGLCYGRLDEQSGAEVLAAHARGLLLPEHLRGRCADPREVQAAASLAYQAGLAPPLLEGLRPVGAPSVAGGLTTVRFRDPDVVVSFTEREVPLGTPATCRSTGNARGREYSLA
jgi:hypothetical protein